MIPKTLICDATGLLRDESGTPYAEPIDSFVAGESNTISQTLVIVRLCQSSKQPKIEGHEIPVESARQFVLTSATARRLARQLIERADEIDGIGQHKH
jgi:hypothetical protein